MTIRGFETLFQAFTSLLVTLRWCVISFTPFGVFPLEIIIKKSLVCLNCLGKSIGNSISSISLCLDMSRVYHQR